MSNTIRLEHDNPNGLLGISLAMTELDLKSILEYLRSLECGIQLTTVTPQLLLPPVPENSLKIPCWAPIGMPLPGHHQIKLLTLCNFRSIAVMHKRTNVIHSP
jgi:hypothetical protein